MRASSGVNPFPESSPSQKSESRKIIIIEKTKYPNWSSGHPKLYIEQGVCKTVMGYDIIDDIIKSFKI